MPRTGHFLLERAKRREQCLCPPMADALYCHSCSGPRGIDKFRGWAKAGIGTIQCERTRAMSEQSQIYYWGLIAQLWPTKGTQWSG